MAFDSTGWFTPSPVLTKKAKAAGFTVPEGTDALVAELAWDIQRGLNDAKINEKIGELAPDRKDAAALAAFNANTPVHALTLARGLMAKKQAEEEAANEERRTSSEPPERARRNSRGRRT